MSRIILAFPPSRQSFSEKLRHMLVQGGYTDITSVLRASEALQEMGRADAGILITCLRLPDMYYRDLLERLPDCFELLLLDTQAQISSCRETDVIALALPVTGRDLLDTVAMMDRNAAEKLRRQRSRQKKQRSQQDINDISNAKAVLMQRNHMTEDEAYRYLQKTSMDTGRTMAETAQMILLISLS